MSIGAIAASPELHPAIASSAYAGALVLVLAASLSRPTRVPVRALFIGATVALTLPIVLLLVARAGVLPLALAALVPLATIGFVLSRSDGPQIAGTGVPLLALAVLLAVADRQVFVAGHALGPDVALAIVTAIACAPLTFAAARWRRAGYALAIASYTVAGLLLIMGTAYRTDAVAATHGGAELLLAGRHPYAEFDMAERLERFGIPREFATDLEDGSSLRSLNYPVLAILVPAPFIAAGLEDVRALYLVEVVALLVLVALSAREPWRPFALAAGIGSVAVTRQFVVAGVDPAWAMLVVAAWITRGHRWSSVLLGLAIAARQPAWLIAPFVVLWAWRRYGPGEAIARAAIAAGVVLAVHAPFLLTAPGAVLAGLTDIVLLPILPHGVGPSGLAVAEVLPALPRGIHFALVLGGSGVALWAYAARVSIPRAAMTLPLLPLFLGWRALQNYFALLPLMLLVQEGRDEER